MAKVYTTMEPITGTNFSSETGFHTSEPEKWVRCYEVEDADAFISHMREYHAIPTEISSREQYESVCSQYGVAAMDDQEITGSYAVTYGMFGGEYHTNPAMRQTCIEMTIAQRYTQAIPTAAPEAVAEIEEEPIELIGGQLWEPCEHCGSEPSYLPHHLCEKCR